MHKIVTKEIKSFTPPEFNATGSTYIFIHKIRRVIAVALATIGGGYFMALSLLIVILVLPILLVKKFQNKLSQAG